jgi:hypothetical protein
MNIDWKEIKNNYPSAYMRFVSSLDKKLVAHNKLDTKYYYSDIDSEIKIEIGERLFNIPFEMFYGILQYFFDNIGLFILIDLNANWYSFKIKSEISNWCNKKYKHRVLFKSIHYLYRDETTVKAIYKAFSILNNQLTERGKV